MFLLPILLFYRKISGIRSFVFMTWSVAIVATLSVAGMSGPVCTQPTLHAADSWESDYGSGEEAKLNAASVVRLREGTQIASTTGRFSRSGRRWIFEMEPATDTAVPSAEASPEGTPAKQEPTPTRFRVLENLALQRVADSVAQDSNDVRWTVTGVITEFDSENWLLLTTVFRASTTPATIEP